MSAGRYLTFHVDDVEYGVQAGVVREIVALPPITRVPDAPAHVSGVVNLRGQIVPVLDLRSLLGTRTTTGSPADWPHASIIVVETASAAAGLIVDDVAEMREVAPLQIRSPAPGGRSGGARAVVAVANLDDRSLLLLDPARILSGPAEGPAQDPTQWRL